MTQKRCLNSKPLAVSLGFHFGVSKVLTSRCFGTIPDRSALSHSHRMQSVILL
jgi:hypothetical protein